MSEPTRYALRPIFLDYTQTRVLGKEQLDAFGEHAPYPHKEGGWVKWEDYARLKAEVERLTEAYVDGKMREDRDALLAQVERLTKAGDAMARVVNSFGFDEAPYAWNRAKEGKSQP